MGKYLEIKYRIGHRSNVRILVKSIQSVEIVDLVIIEIIVFIFCLMLILFFNSTILFNTFLFLLIYLLY